MCCCTHTPLLFFSCHVSVALLLLPCRSAATFAETAESQWLPAPVAEASCSAQRDAHDCCCGWALQCDGAPAACSACAVCRSLPCAAVTAVCRPICCASGAPRLAHPRCCGEQRVRQRNEQCCEESTREGCDAWPLRSAAACCGCGWKCASGVWQRRLPLCTLNSGCVHAFSCGNTTNSNPTKVNLWINRRVTDLAGAEELMSGFVQLRVL